MNLTPEKSPNSSSNFPVFASKRFNGRNFRINLVHHGTVCNKFLIRKSVIKNIVLPIILS
ncbi:hypothetical protein B1H10_05050 [candidate division KSB1 bacterium 4484_188]|nr:MAG: hypothetical protein B1H10_05050 [candidate division KSB1 bacterium 4484_188]